MKKNILKNTILACTVAAGILTIGGTTSEAALGDRALSQGMRHSDVKELQQVLKDKNYFTHSSTTTYFGNITKQAVKRFQKANGLSVDGSFGPASYRALKGSSSSKGNKVQASVPKTASSLSYKRALRQGSKGSDVGALQAVLKKLGHYKSSIDNSFGPGTRSAVVSFQRAQNISVDGSVGPATVRTINAVLGGKQSAGKPSSTPSRGNSSKGGSIGIVNTAKKFIGGRYVYGGSSPSGFDCTGFTQYVYKQFGISIPRTTNAQARVGRTVSKSQLQAGDLVVFKNTYKSGPSHAGVYIGNGQFVHASTPSKGVRVDSINSNYYSSKFHSGRRVY